MNKQNDLRLKQLIKRNNELKSMIQNGKNNYKIQFSNSIEYVGASRALEYREMNKRIEILMAEIKAKLYGYHLFRIQNP